VAVGDSDLDGGLREQARHDLRALAGLESHVGRPGALREYMYSSWWARSTLRSIHIHLVQALGIGELGYRDSRPVLGAAELLIRRGAIVARFRAGRDARVAAGQSLLRAVVFGRCATAILWRATWGRRQINNSYPLAVPGAYAGRAASRATEFARVRVANSPAS
jgi:hypothetical protein